MRTRGFPSYCLRHAIRVWREIVYVDAEALELAVSDPEHDVGKPRLDSRNDPGQT